MILEILDMRERAEQHQATGVERPYRNDLVWGCTCPLEGCGAGFYADSDEWLAAAVYRHMFPTHGWFEGLSEAEAVAQVLETGELVDWHTRARQSQGAGPTVTIDKADQFLRSLE